jgi:lipopolysaccharide/colanic/teichoic acid biosynthesis glycosyltransferase
MIRFYDLLLSILALLVLAPVMMVIGAWIVVDSGWPVFYRQVRVGQSGRQFKLWKFRTMFAQSDKKGLLTVGFADRRITRVGRVLRKYKLDELPQLFNVIGGGMSLVGPRPEVPKYTAMYTDEQRRVLEVKPGITDWASIEYAAENEVLAAAPDPEKAYVEEIMPHKITLNLRYIDHQTPAEYFRVLAATLRKLILG